MAAIVDFIKYKSELLASMTEMVRFVKGVGKRIVFVDNAVWLVCSRSGLNFTNNDIGQVCSWLLLNFQVLCF